MLSGIDISHHNKDYISSHDINLRQIARNGFVIMKASEGVTYKDPMLDLYYNQVHGSGDGRPDPGVQYGFFHYAHPEWNSAADEVRNFLRVIRHHAGYALYALDVEQDAFKASDLDRWVYNWCSLIHEAIGVKPLVYCQKSGIKKLSKTAGADFGLWIPAWQKTAPANVKPWDFWAIWQYSDAGLDRDYFNGDKEQWHKYCARFES